MPTVILDSGIPRGLSTSAYNERRGQCEEGVSLIRDAMQASESDLSALRDVTPEMLQEAKPILPEVIYRRCRHVVSENRRVIDAAEALEQKDMQTVGMLLAASHVSMRDDYEISLPEIDRLVEIAAETPGCFGARLTGAGFGGAVVALIAADRTEDVASDVIGRYRKETGRPGKKLSIQPDEGARVDLHA